MDMDVTMQDVGSKAKGGMGSMWRGKKRKYGIYEVWEVRDRLSHTYIPPVTPTSP